MSVQSGFEDLRPRRVISIDLIDSTLTCVNADGTKLNEMALYVSPTGALMARPLETRPIDQLVGGNPLPHRGVDQV